METQTLGCPEADRSQKVAVAPELRAGKRPARQVNAESCLNELVSREGGHRA
jgi:hypothetical protein